MAFEKGNQHSTKSKLFEGALKRAIAQDDGKRLRDAAESLLTNAAEGQPWALSMLADRLDGKAAQSVEVTHNRSLQEMSLDELRSRVAELLTGEAAAGGDRPALGGPGITH